MTWNESEHPRVPKGKTTGGQFTSKGGGGAATAERSARDAAGLPSGLMAKLKTEGGFSESVDGESPSGGYMVAKDNTVERVIKADQITDEAILDYVLDHFDKLNQPDAYLGGWVDEGKVYLDISYNVKDREEALRMARKHDQLGIYDLNSGETIYTKEKK